MAEKILNSRIIQKHDTEANWLKATNFKPMAGEVIIYDADEINLIPRVKIGNGETLVNELPFATNQGYIEQMLFDINSQITIDYNQHLAFNTSEIVFSQNSSVTSAILGEAILGQLVLGMG